MLDSRRLLLLSSISLVGCAQILGIDDFKDDGGGGSGTTTTGDTTSSSGGTGGSGASGATGGTGGNTGGVGGTGGSGGTGGQVMICTPDEEEECAYGGPVGTKDVGICVAAKRKCAPDGLSYGACAGEVLPSNEICVGGLDEDCNNMIDDGCACTPNAVEPCYSGPGGTGGVGICVIGTHTCMPNGMGYGACNGEVTPAVEACSDTTDQDCDGREAANGGVDDTSGCLCVPNASRACYTGPSGTSGVGLCHGGNETCQATGTAYGACAGQVTPASEVCTGVGDENCDGFACSESFWANLVGESATLQYPYGVTHDPAGNVYAVGDFFGSVTVGGTTLISAGSTDIFVVKYSPTGAVLWAKRFGDGGEDHALDVAATANEVYVQSSAPVDFGAGLGTGMSIARLTAAAGTHSWTRSCSETVSAFVGDEYRQGGLTVDTTGAVIAVFPAAGGMACSGGASLLGISGNEYTGMVKYSTTGTHAWSKLTGGNASGGAKPYEVVADASNSVWVTGGFDGAISFGGSMLTSAGGSDVFLVKFDSTGGHSFSARYGDASNQNAFSVGVSSTGGPAITGSLSGSTNFGGSNLTSGGGTDVFVARFLSTGSHAASAPWRGTGSEWGTSVGYQANGDIWVTGRGSNTLNFGGGALTLAFLARMSGALTSHRWSRGYPANFINAGSASAVDGRIAVVGGLIGSGNFGGKVLNGGTSTDAFVLSVDP